MADAYSKVWRMGSDMADTSENSGTELSGTAVGTELDPSRTLSMAKGFSCVFRGVFIALVLGFTNAFIDFFNIARVPAYVIGSAIAVWGMFLLNDAGAVSQAWVRRKRAALAAFLLQLYFAPFISWWRASPHAPFLIMNCLALVLVGMLGLFSLNLLAAESARLLRDEAGRFESLLSAAAVFFVMIVPFSIFVLKSGSACVRGASTPCLELAHLKYRAPLWIYGIIALPCVLTLVSLWKARSRCYRAFLVGS